LFNKRFSDGLRAARFAHAAPPPPKRYFVDMERWFKSCRDLLVFFFVVVHQLGSVSERDESVVEVGVIDG
jgi:hypothetical protein